MFGCSLLNHEQCLVILSGLWICGHCQILNLLFKHVDEGKLGGDVVWILLLAAVTIITIALRMM